MAEKKRLLVNLEAGDLSDPAPAQSRRARLAAWAFSFALCVLVTLIFIGLKRVLSSS